MQNIKILFSVDSLYISLCFPLSKRSSQSPSVWEISEQTSHQMSKQSPMPQKLQDLHSKASRKHIKGNFHWSAKYQVKFFCRTSSGFLVTGTTNNSDRKIVFFLNSSIHYLNHYSCFFSYLSN